MFISKGMYIKNNINIDTSVYLITKHFFSNTLVVGLYRLMESLGYEHKCDGLIPVNGILWT
jgi:hypothetical protein